MKKESIFTYLIVTLFSIGVILIIGIVYQFGGHTTKINKVTIEHLPAQHLKIKSTEATTTADTHGVGSPTLEEINDFYRADNYSLLITFEDGSTYTTSVDSLDLLKSPDYRPGATIERIVEQTKATYDYSIYDRNGKFIKKNSLTVTNPNKVEKEGKRSHGNTPKVDMGSNPVTYLTKEGGIGPISLDIQLQHRAIVGVKVKTALTVDDGKLHFDI